MNATVITPALAAKAVLRWQDRRQTALEAMASAPTPFAWDQAQADFKLVEHRLLIALAAVATLQQEGAL